MYIMFTLQIDNKSCMYIYHFLNRFWCREIKRKRGQILSSETVFSKRNVTDLYHSAVAFLMADWSEGTQTVVLAAGQIACLY